MPEPDTSPIRALCKLLQQQARYLTSKRANLQRQLAAAGLARCRALLDAMLILHEAGRADVIGALCRVHCEAWMMGRYLILRLGDDSVLMQFAHRDAMDIRKILREQGRDIEEGDVLKEWFDTFDENAVQSPPHWDRIARSIGAMDVYTNVYRRECYAGTHAGYYALHPYLALDDDGYDGLHDNPGNEHPWGMWEAAQLTGDLAIHVYRAFDVVRNEIERVEACVAAIAAAKDAAFREHPRCRRQDAR